MQRYHAEVRRRAKVLPDAFARDAERMARVQREAGWKVVLPEGPLPFDDASKIAAQIAAAVEYTHDRESSIAT